MLSSKNTIAIPPGATIHEQLVNRGISQKEFALRMGMTEKHISRLINGKVELTIDVAIRLENVLGIPASYWSKLESIYREKLVRVKSEQELEEDCVLAKQFPYPKIADLGWVPKTRDINQKVKYLRRFFEVTSLKILDDLCVPGIAYRSMGESVTSDYALAAWAQQARREARGVEASPINIKQLNKNVNRIRELITLPPEEFCKELRKILCECGVVIVFLPHIGGSFLHGASFVDGKHIVLGLTVRGKDADKFWFSLFHELYHIIEGHIYRRDGTSNEEEYKADEFARNILISPEDYNHFVIANDFSKAAIFAFANQINILPGIIVGRLQKENIIPYNWHTDLKNQYRIVL